jgi:integrase
MNQVTEVIEHTKGGESQKDIVTFGNRPLSYNSMAVYERAIREYQNYLKDRGQEEDSESVKAWLEIVRENHKPATFNLKQQALKNYLVEKYKNDGRQLLGIQRLFKGIRRQKVEKSILRHEYLTWSEIEGLLSVLSTRMALIAETLFWTGCRVSELIDIRVKDVKENGQYAIVSVQSGKGNKERTVYIPSELYQKVKWVFKGKEYLFETKNGTPYNRTNLFVEIRRQAKKHGCNITPHTLRHSKAMYLKDEKNLSADRIAKALGHSSVITTLQCYFHGTPTAEEQGII